MSISLLRTLRRVSLPFRQFSKKLESTITLSRPSWQLAPNLQNSVRMSGLLSQWRNLSHGSVSLVISPEGKPKFETHKIEPPKKEKWQTKKRFKLQKMREKRKRKAANKRDPRKLGVKGKKKRQRFATAEERIKYKLDNARIKETLLIERLKRYEVPKAQGPVVEPCVLTGEERFYMKKMAQKRTNYVPVGRRGIFGGVILNMHMHWKKHETVEVICKPCKPGQVHEYANEIARLSGEIPIQIIGDNTIIFYRGKNYFQPDVMSPVDTLSKKRALEKSKYEQSLESVRRFIAIAEKELELYYRHVALYGDPNDRDPKSVLDHPKVRDKTPEKGELANKYIATRGKDFESFTGTEACGTNQELSEMEDNYENERQSSYETDCEDDLFSKNSDSSDEEVDDDWSSMEEGITEDSDHSLYREMQNECRYSTALLRENQS